MLIHGIDPGTTESAIVTWDGVRVRYGVIMENEMLLSILRQSDYTNGIVAIESIASYGMAVGRETFETCEWCGRFREAAENRKAKIVKVYRREVKIHYCGTMKAKDANVRQALIDKLGVVGTKAKPGPLHGIASHLWSALAVADYALTQQAQKDAQSKG